MNPANKVLLRKQEPSVERIALYPGLLLSQEHYGRRLWPGGDGG